ncbi:hypothetical protein [Streptomyces griseorubiginosus]|uniref:hypothetical protein n=1 Tax=Streptomyces griseorubiginosus TaxID=67304 RepID=UPI0036E6DB28
MTSMQPSPASGDGPGEPRGFAVALAGSYAAGYSAALGVGGQSLTMTLAQGAAAAICWIFWRRQRQ